MGSEREVCEAEELGPREVVGIESSVVGRTADGELFALSRKCRHLRADLAEGSIDKAGCLVCPSHGARINVETGKMTRGPQGLPSVVEKAVRTFSGWFPQRARSVSERDGTIYLD